jgi:phosphotransferase family enzyme
MRLPLFRPTDEQRAALRSRLERLQQPQTMLEVVRRGLPNDLAPTTIDSCELVSAHPDRAVLQVRVRVDSRGPRTYAVKIYSDDIVEGVWRLTRAMAGRDAGDEDDGMCLPIGFVPAEQTLISPWIDGTLLTEVPHARKRELLQRASAVTATLHQLAVAPEPPTTISTLLDETGARCDRMRTRWPEAVLLAEPLLDALRHAATSLDPAEPAPVHGDLGGAQFLWTGGRLVLFDWDRFGYTDPAFDVGHFLAQLDRICIVDPQQQAYAREWTASFTRAYFAAMPRVSRPNVEFFRAMTLVWKIHTICRVQPGAWPQLVPRLALAAHAALDARAAPA